MYKWRETESESKKRGKVELTGGGWGVMINGFLKKVLCGVLPRVRCRVGVNGIFFYIGKTFQLST